MFHQQVRYSQLLQLQAMCEQIRIPTILLICRLKRAYPYRNMTSLTRNKKFKNQEGVTLLLTILVLVAISALTFSFASIAFNEVKTSGGISDSEPAITGAEAVTEDLLYKSVRGFISTCGTTETDTLSSSGVTVNAISS